MSANTNKKDKDKTIWKKFFPTGQSFLNIVYLLLAFPLGIFYFVFLVTGFSLGLGLLVTIIGIFVLAGVFVICLGLASFERVLTKSLLGADIKKKTIPENIKGKLSWESFKFYLSSISSWKGIMYLFLKFPLGIFSFCLVVTLISLSLGLILSPLEIMFFEAERIMIFQVVINIIMGFGLLIASFQIMDGLAFVSGKLAEVLLGDD